MLIDKRNVVTFEETENFKFLKSFWKSKVRSSNSWCISIIDGYINDAGLEDLHN